MGVVVRPMLRDELDWAVSLAAAEGWNPGLGDAEAFFAADPEGFLIGDIDGRPVGCISAVRYPGGFGFMGFYIVLPEFRGQGLSKAIWDAGIARMAGYNAGGDGVVEMTPKYLTVGFNYAYRNIRFRGDDLPRREPSESIVAIDQVDPEMVFAYDRRCFPADRGAFLTAWLANPTAVSLAAVSEGNLKGFGTIRQCHEGYKIGPLFADDFENADSIFAALCNAVDRGPVFLDVPEPNPGAMRLASKYGMVRVFETARIYTGEIPEIDLNRVFGVTSFELG